MDGEYTRVTFRRIRDASGHVTYIVGGNPVLWWSGLPKDFQQTHQMGVTYPATQQEYAAFLASVEGTKS